jgi:hypothetical protein
MYDWLVALAMLCFVWALCATWVAIGNARELRSLEDDWAKYVTLVAEFFGPDEAAALAFDQHVYDALHHVQPKRAPDYSIKLEDAPALAQILQLALDSDGPVSGTVDADGNVHVDK